MKRHLLYGLIALCVMAATSFVSGNEQPDGKGYESADPRGPAVPDVNKDSWSSISSLSTALVLFYVPVRVKHALAAVMAHLDTGRVIYLFTTACA